MGGLGRSDLDDLLDDGRRRGGDARGAQQRQQTPDQKYPERPACPPTRKRPDDLPQHRRHAVDLEQVVREVSEKPPEAAIRLLRCAADVLQKSPVLAVDSCWMLVVLPPRHTRVYRTRQAWP